MTKLGGMPGTKSARVFVAKLPPGVTDEMFNDYFAEFGELVDAYMPKDRTRQHYRGIGFVHFKKEADAEHVVSSKHRFFGHLVIVDFASPRADERQKNTPQNTTTSKEHSLMMLHNLIMWSADDDQEKACSPKLDQNYVLPTPPKDPIWGPSSDDIGLLHLSKIYAAPEPRQLPAVLNTQTSKESGVSLLKQLSQFLELPGLPETPTNTTPEANSIPAGSAEEDPAACVTTADEPGTPANTASDAPESPLAPSSTSSGSSHTTPRCSPRVYVGRVPLECTDADLLDCFKRFGAVSDIYMPRSKTDKSKHRGFAFVSFYSMVPIKKIAAHGPLMLHGSLLALDYAMP